MIPQSKNCSPWAFGLGDDKRGGRGLFQDADTSQFVWLHPVGSSKECWTAMRNGMFRKAGESLEQGDPGDLEELFLKKQ